MRGLLIIGLGGMLGSIARYLTGQAINKLFTYQLPVGTLAVNMAGALLIGIVIGMGERFRWFNEPWHFFLAIGFCGSFTTYSTFAYENYTLLKEGHLASFMFYVVISLVVGIMLAWLGYALTRWM